MPASTVCILPGFTEGHSTSRKLRKLLTARGFIICKDPVEADVIVAHSGGCFIIPKQAQPQLTILINIPYWPGKYAVVSIREKITTTFVQSLSRHTFGQWLIELCIRSIYGTNMRHNIAMLKGMKKGDLWKRTDPHTVVIRNAQDMFCTPELATLPLTTQPTCLELPGSHDDCWNNPETYAAIIQKYHEQYVLAKTS